MVDNVNMEHGAYVRCRLRQDLLTLTVASGTAPIERIACPLDAVRQVLLPDRLDGARLEQAIARTEDLIMPILARLPPQARLQVLGTDMQAIRDLLQDDPGDAVPLASVEHLFNHFAERVLGSVSSWPYDTDPGTIALPLVVLRELMHHGGFDACEWPERGTG